MIMRLRHHFTLAQETDGGTEVIISVSWRKDLVCLLVVDESAGAVSLLAYRMALHSALLHRGCSR